MRCHTCTSGFGSVTPRRTSTLSSSFRLVVLPTLRPRPRRRPHLHRPLRRLLPSQRRLPRRLRPSRSRTRLRPGRPSRSRRRMSRKINRSTQPIRSPTPLSRRERPGSGSARCRRRRRPSFGSSARQDCGSRLRGHRRPELAASRRFGGTTARCAPPGRRHVSSRLTRSASGSAAIAPGVAPTSLRSSVRRQRFPGPARGARSADCPRLRLS